MKDIYDIKNIGFLDLLDQRFWVIFFMVFFAILFIWLLILIYKKYKKNIELIEQNELKKRRIKEKYLYLIKNIDKSNLDRFFKLNLYVRDYLEKSWTIEKSTKKTKSELKTWKSDFDRFFEICEKAEFWKKSELWEFEVTDFEEVRGLAKKIIEK